jgi:hypothetical protein
MFGLRLRGIMTMPNFSTRLNEILKDLSETVWAKGFNGYNDGLADNKITHASIITLIREELVGDEEENDACDGAQYVQGFADGHNSCRKQFLDRLEKKCD